MTVTSASGVDLFGKDVEHLRAGARDRARMVAAMEKLAAGGAVDVKSLGEGLWELRVRGDQRAYRIVFARRANVLIAVSAFEKKQRRNLAAIEAARERHRQWVARGERR